MRFYTIPSFVQYLYPHRLWRVKTQQKEIFLTFDDGPQPEVTSWVLDQLRMYKAKATFFCVGENIEKYPEIFQRLKDEGHKAGNHTFHHKNGWRTSVSDYMSEVKICEKLTGTRLFRPPYGKIKGKQAQALRQKGYTIVMWDLLSYDFDKESDAENTTALLKRKAKPGSVIVFHDSLKAFEKLQYILPRLLVYFSMEGYRFSAL